MEDVQIHSLGIKGIYLYRSTVLGSNVYMYTDQVPFKANQHWLSAQHTTHHTTLDSENRVVTTRPTVMESTAHRSTKQDAEASTHRRKHNTKGQQAFIWLLLAGGSLRWSNRAFMLTEEHVSLDRCYPFEVNARLRNHSTPTNIQKYKQPVNNIIQISTIVDHLAGQKLTNQLRRSNRAFLLTEEHVSLTAVIR